MATTVVPCTTSNGGPPPLGPGAGGSSGVTRRSRSTNDEPGSLPGEKNGSGPSFMAEGAYPWSRRWLAGLRSTAHDAPGRAAVDGHAPAGDERGHIGAEHDDH